MTSEHETGIGFEQSTRYPEQPPPTSSEGAYDRLTGYGFARRFVTGKIVADIAWKEVGYGSRLLAETAESVEILTNSPEAIGLVSAAYYAPNLRYRNVNLPELPYSEGYFDVVIAFGVVENLEFPEGLVSEAKRVLKQDGMLIISAMDKQTNTNERNRESVEGPRDMYVLQIRELLERHFGYVRIYRQGAVAGGFVFPASEERASALVESARLSLTHPGLGTEPPKTRSVIAVCNVVEALGQEALGQEEQPYLLLDRDRRVFDECEERAEDVELLRGEIQRMQETEVQAFLNALRSYESRAAKVDRSLTHLRNLIRGAKRRLLGPRRQKSQE